MKRGNRYFWVLVCCLGLGLLGVRGNFTSAAGVFSADFEDGNAGEWASIGGNWAVVADGSKVLRQSSIIANTYAAAGSSVWTNYTVQARLKIVSFNGTDRFIGLCARYRDSNNFYYLRLSNKNTMEIRKKVNGSTTSLAATAYTIKTGTWYTVKLVVDGSALSGYINGTLVLTARDTTFSTGKIGLTMVNASVEFDAVTVETLTNTATATPSQAPPTATVTGGTPQATSASGTYHLVVAKDGSGNYTTVQAAINAVPANNRNWFTIYIKNGIYQEVVTVPAGKTYVRLLGESAAGTKLTYNRCSSTAGGTAASASVFFQANNLIAENLTFENSFDYDNSSLPNKQAVAAEPAADRQAFINCRFIGHQDTLYVRFGRQYFKNCYIEGHVDFIFGDATAVFDRCTIYSLYRNGSCVAAPSTSANTAYGLVFLNCTVSGDARIRAKSVHLGRPWHPGGSMAVKSHAAYLYCNLGPHIATAGWTSMGGVQPATERFFEYQNSGSGAAVNSSRPQFSSAAAANYTVANLLKGSDHWNPAGIP
jgi:pectin methylesterase-like acyl-CoA thioesterase